MRALCASLAAATMLLAAGAARAQTAQVVGTCGTAGPPGGWDEGVVANLTMTSGGQLCIGGAISANSSANAAATLPTLSAGNNAFQQSLGGGLYVQPIFGSASGGGTQVDATHGLPTNCISGCAATPAIIPAASTVAESSHVFKSSAGTLYSLTFTNQGAAGFLLFIDATAVPANGTITGVKGCVAVPSGSSSSPASVSIGSPSGVAGMSAANGIVGVYSTTGCFTQTLGSPVGYFQAVFQ